MRSFYVVLGSATAAAAVLHLTHENYGFGTFCILLTGFWLRQALTFGWE